MYTVEPGDIMQTGMPDIVLVGCGGTGSLAAEGLCRLGVNSKLTLIDPDRVEEHNLRRQNFYEGDVGRFKSEVLATRLARQYRRPVEYSVLPYEADMLDGTTHGFTHKAMRKFIIGCVDNAAARIEIARKMPTYSWWLDAGNGHHSGQVFIGDTGTLEGLHKSFESFYNNVSHLPLPSLQQPALLLPTVEPVRRDCAEAVRDEEQSPVINQAMAMLVVEFARRFLTRRLSWMQAYIDLDAGTLNTVAATPHAVAKMLSMKENFLTEERCDHGRAFSQPENEDD